MDDLIELMNEISTILYRANLKNSINLPEIAVVGSQGTGKTSTLEMIVGEDFLPRGVGIVTRCILNLQLIHQECEVYAQFSHKNKMFKNFDEVRQEIMDRTDVLAGSGKKVSSEEIFLKIYSPKVPTLTLIDLPGIRQNDTEDVEKGTSEAIRKLVMERIKRPNTIILAISSATDEIANSVGIAWAKEVDPNSERTFGVISKIDEMAKGTDAWDYLTGKAYKLQHGYVGVRCRSKEETDNGITIGQAIEIEQDFFANTQPYNQLEEKQGSEVLARKLSALLIK
jgi:GTPase SAR1 family protein